VSPGPHAGCGRSLRGVSAPSGFGLVFDNSFVRALPELCESWQAAEASTPVLLTLNDAVALELGLDPDALRSEAGVRALLANPAPHGAAPVAQAYAGHQFGSFNPRLGDGRALLIGEVIDTRGRRRDLHLKGSGRTPFARGGDGKAAVGPMLREYVMSEAMHALGIATTRSLAVLSTGEPVARETMLPGAVLHRVAASHLRVGSFEYAMRHPDTALIRRLADYAIERHYPDTLQHPQRYLAFFERVVDAQASLIAQWMLVGFIHGVMNTDNMLVSAETIDYGPCAFMDAYHPGTVFSSIDHGGRYAYGNQPIIAQWNLARLGESLIGLMDDDWEAAVEPATEVLRSFSVRYQRYFDIGLQHKIGLAAPSDEGALLARELLAVMEAHGVDYTSTFRALARSLRGDRQSLDALIVGSDVFAGWHQRWSEAVAAQGVSPHEAADSMDAINPIYIPRNHLVDEALNAATNGDLAPFDALVAVLASPFTERTGLERYAQPAPPEFAAGFRTFCGT